MTKGKDIWHEKFHYVFSINFPPNSRVVLQDWLSFSSVVENVKVTKQQGAGSFIENWPAFCIRNKWPFYLPIMSFVILASYSQSL